MLKKAVCAGACSYTSCGVNNFFHIRHAHILVFDLPLWKTYPLRGWATLHNHLWLLLYPLWTRGPSSVALPASVLQVQRTTTPRLQSHFLRLCHHPVPYFQLRCRAVPPTSSMSSCIPIPSFRALLHITLSTLCFLGVAASRPTQNVTLQVPYGTTDHGDPDSLCIPPTWIDIASFILFNYIAHGATVVSNPGDSSTFGDVVIAILLPITGIKRALNSIFRHPRLTAKNDLEVAARSGALCMLIRKKGWKPRKGDDIKNALINDPGNILLRRGRKTGRSDRSAIKSLTYVPTYSYSRPSKLNEVFSLIPKYCHLFDVLAAMAQ